MSRILPRYTDHAIEHDPLETMLAAREAQELAAREAINSTNYRTPDPQDLRGIPVQALGVSGTSPGTDPLATLIAKERAAERHRIAA